MRRLRTSLALLVLGACLPAHATYSIVARDPRTGELGVAVQSHWFSVGSIVSWAESGVGAVATQAAGDPTYGKLGLDLMRAGRPAPAELRRLVTVQRAYNHLGAGDAAVARKDPAGAKAEYEAALRLLPKSAEVRFWYAVGLVSLDRFDAALPVFKEVFALEPRWREAVPRVARAGILPGDDKLLRRILAQ
jgi:tetratricopeptide (TPR) repeat protein